jgi:hypothetical protein
MFKHHPDHGTLIVQDIANAMPGNVNASLIVFSCVRSDVDGRSSCSTHAVLNIEPLSGGSLAEASNAHHQVVNLFKGGAPFGGYELNSANITWLQEPGRRLRVDVKLETVADYVTAPPPARPSWGALAWSRVRGFFDRG